MAVKKGSMVRAVRETLDNSLEASATAWAWLPDECVMIPLSPSSFGNFSIALHAPLNLKAPTF